MNADGTVYTVGGPSWDLNDRKYDDLEKAMEVVHEVHEDDEAIRFVRKWRYDDSNGVFKLIWIVEHKAAAEDDFLL